MKIYRHRETGVEIKETFFNIYVGKDVQLPKDLVENSRDWVLKEYEVLSFSYGDDGFTTLRDNGKYFSTSSPNKFDPNGYFCGYTKEQELSFGGKVHSIKRLSDGEIFTVGDKLIGGLEILSIVEGSLWVGGLEFVCGSDASLGLHANSLVKVPEKSYTPSQLKKIYKELNLDNGKINHSVQRFFNELEKGV